MAQESIDIRINTKLEAAASETDLRKLRGLLKDLQSLGEEVGDPASASFKKLAESINEVEGKIGDAADRMKTISGEPLDRVNAGFSLMSEGLSNLDFGKAKIGLDGMTEGLGKLKLKEVAGGVKEVSGSFLKLAGAIATNPIFLLATTIILIIKNFDKLKAAGGAIGDMFKGIGAAIEFTTDFLKRFSDALGFTTIKQNELDEANKAAAESTEAYYNTIIDGEIAAADVMNKSTLALEFEKQQRVLDKAFKDLKELIKDKLKNDEEFKKLEEKIQNETLENVKKYFGNKYGSTKEGFDALAKVYDEWEKKDILLKSKQLKRDKDILDEENKNKLKRAELLQDGLQSRLKVSEEGEKQQSDLIREQIEKRKADIKTADENRANGFAAAKADEKKAIELEAIKENNLNERILLDKRYKTQKGYQLIYADKMAIQIKDAKEEVRMAKEQTATLKALVKNRGELLEKEQEAATKQLNEQLVLLEKEEAKKRRQFLIDERIKTNQRLQDLNKANLDKVMADDDKNWAQRIDAENGFFKEQEDLLMKSLSLQLQKSGLSEEDKLKLRQDYVLKTEELYKNHFTTVDKLYENSGNNIIKTMQSSIDELNKMVTDSINKTADNIVNAELKRQADSQTRDQAELNRLKMHLDRTGGFQTHYEKNLIRKLHKDRNDILDLQRTEELQKVEKGSEEEKLIKDKYLQLELESREQKDAQIVQANVDKIDKIAAYGAAAMEATQLIMDLGSLKDKERLKKGEITEEQFQRKEFNRKKAASIASIVMNTAEAISKAIALSPATGGAPFSIIAAALGALQFAKVTSTTFNYASPAQSTSSSSGGSGASTNRDLAAPGNPYFGQGFLNLNSFNPNQIGGMKVYVLEQDIRNAMNRATVLNNRNML